jgi:hypothetical protein
LVCVDVFYEYAGKSIILKRKAAQYEALGKEAKEWHTLAKGYLRLVRNVEMSDLSMSQ